MTGPRISRDEVEHVARLARLALTPEEVAKFGAQLSDILAHIAVLGEVDLSAVPPTAQVTGLEDVMRDDATWEGLSTAQALANAPAREGDFFAVQHVFEEGQAEDVP